jgi:hypothetical protein
MDYQFVIVPTGLSEDRWVSKVEIRPGDPSVVHHAVVYVREPSSSWLAGKPTGIPFTNPDATTSDILFTYTPGNSFDEWPSNMAKLIPAGSDLVFQMHYTPGKKTTLDRTRIGVVYSKTPPAQRVLTLQLNNARFVIPPGHPDFRVTARGSLPADALLLSFFPHMHLRGKAFEYAVTANGERRILLNIPHYDFYWQLTYRLAQPLPVKAGTWIECTGTFDNSKNNPRNPDPNTAVRYGQQSTDEMMVGFFDVAVDAQISKQHYFDLREPPTRALR